MEHNSGIPEPKSQENYRKIPDELPIAYGLIMTVKLEAKAANAIAYNIHEID
jgi:hypothetical protein